MFRVASSLAADLRVMPRGVWVLVGGQFINRFGGFVQPFLALYLQQRGLRLSEVTLVLGAIAAGQLAAPFASGYLSDAIGRRLTIVVSLVGGALSLLGIYFCATLPPLLAMAAVHGFFAFMYGPAANALLTDLVTLELRVTAYALLRLAINAGFAAGPAVAGLLFARNPLLIFLGDAATTLVFAVLAWTLLPHGLRTIAGQFTSPAVILHSWLEAGRDAVRNGPFVQLVGGMLLMGVAFAQVLQVLALHATARGLDTVQYGVVMGCNGFVVMLVELPLSRWITRFPARAVLIIGFTAVGLGCALFAFASTMNEFLAAMALFTTGEMLSLPVCSARIARLAPLAYRGRYFGFHSMVWSLSGLAGSAGVWCYGTFGARWWLWSGAISAFGAVVMVKAPREQRPAVASAPVHPA